MIVTVILEGVSKAATVLSALMKVYTIPCHDTGYINVMLVLQSCSDPLHILPSSSSDTNAPSGGVCNFSNTDVEEDVDVIEEMFVSLNEEVERGIKQEEIPRDIIFPDIKSEADEVSYFCLCMLLDTFYQVGQWEGVSVLVGLVKGGSVLGRSVGGRVCTGWVVGGRVCTLCVGRREGLYWLGRWEGRSVLGGSVGGRVCIGWFGGREGLYWMGWLEGRSVLGGSVGWRVCTGSICGREGLYWVGQWEGLYWVGQ